MPHHKATLLFATLTLILSGCASLTPPKQVQAKVIETTRNNIITTPKISSLANAVLLSAGQTQDGCLANFDGCLQDLQNAFFGDELDQDALVLMAELHYAHALSLMDNFDCKPALDRPPINDYYANPPTDPLIKKTQNDARQHCQAKYRDALYKTVIFSYGYLFFDALTGKPTNKAIITDNDIRAQDLYHVAINALIQEIYKQDGSAFLDGQRRPMHKTNHAYNHLGISQITTKDQSGQNTANLYIADDAYLLGNLGNLQDNQTIALTDLISIYDSRLADLQVNSSRSGLGVGFVGSLKDRYHLQANQDKSDINARIHPMGHLLLTGVIIPKGNTLHDVLHTHEFDIHFFNPYTTKDISLFGKKYPLSASFSSTYATWLEENNLQRTSILNMLADTKTTLPELFMLSPYNPNQRVIIMIHGLASSPATWVNLTNNLLSDPVLRQNYQVWQIFYATNLPILENRYHIHQLINHAFATTDPNGTHPASKQAILIGHSMGGVISRMLVSNDDLSHQLDKLTSTDQNISTRTLKKLTTSDNHQDLQQRLSLNALNQVDTAIFISAPFRGTDYADRWFTRAARRVIRLPLDLTKSVGDAITHNDESTHHLLSDLYLQNGASQLSDQSAFIKLTQDITTKPNLRYHTIMGDHQGLTNTTQHPTDVVAQKLSDGIVPYTSSHLQGANSETIITGKHNIHENPKTILQLRKILHDELKNHHSSK